MLDNSGNLEDLSVRKVLYFLASSLRRNVVVAEVKANLLKEDRASLMERFPKTQFKRIAHIVMGEPAKSFKDRQQNKWRAEKRKFAEMQQKRDEMRLKQEQ